MGTYSPTTRTLRNGALAIADGTSPSPKTVSGPCMDGDVTWTIAKSHSPDYCRGTLTGWRKGNLVPCKLSFTVKMGSLLGKTANSGDPITIYEILNNVGGGFASTSVIAGGGYSVDITFTLSSPDAANAYDEVVSFTDCVINSCVCGEGEQANTIKVDAEALIEQPTITRD